MEDWIIIIIIIIIIIVRCCIVIVNLKWQIRVILFSKCTLHHTICSISLHYMHAL